MDSQIRIVKSRTWAFSGLSVFSLFLLVAPLHATITPCAAVDFPTLQGCINKAALAKDTGRTDTVLVNVASGTYFGAQIRINQRKNLWILGDTLAAESAQPRIVYQDQIHVNTDTIQAMREDTSLANVYGQNNGTVWVYHSDNIRLMGLLIDGNNSTATTNVTGHIFAYGANLGKAHPVEIRGNVGVNILNSRNVQLRYLSVTNAWNGISIISPNLGGAFAFPDPNDPLAELVATLPTSRAGLYGNHLIERCRIHDNTFGMLFQRDWDLSSVIRNNLFWGNYLRHWSDPKTPRGYVTNLEVLDKAVRADGSYRSLAYTTVGGAFLMTDVALTPYRIHNNTFYNNATIFSGYYKTGTQHLFYNNLVGRPYQFFRSAVDLNVQLNADGVTFGNGYTQTERTSEMLQYLSEHQRSNRVVVQDSIPLNPNVVPNYWGALGGNFRLYNMRMIRTVLPAGFSDWLVNGGRGWSNQQGDQDSLGMTWVPDTAALGTIAVQGDTGGIVRWIRHNMWAGARKDPGSTGRDVMDPNPIPANGAPWCPPWIPFNIRASLGDPTIFRNTAGFDVRWTLGLPIDTVSPKTSAGWLAPLPTTNLGLKGWNSYEGSPTQPLAIGAYDPAGGWAAPSKRLVLRDTLIESVSDSIVKFRLNVSGQGISNSDITKLEVYSAKFYNDVPVSDTLYNQGPAAGGGTTTRVNSILSSKPWPLPYNFLKTDYDRPGYQVDDSLTKNKLQSGNEFVARIGAANRLPPDSLYARAEVVLLATLADGSQIFSNPGVFMFSRPRFQFSVTVLDAATGKPLPADADGISIVAQARQPLKVVIKAKTVAVLPVPFKGYGNLQMGDAGLLHGDGRQLEKELLGVWSVRHPNDTITPGFDQNDSVLDTLRADLSPSHGTLRYTAVFRDKNGFPLPYYIEGRSAPIKVVSGSIYQVTIDSILRYDTLPILTPSVKLKVAANEKLAGRRDTMLVDGTDSSLNVTKIVKGERLLIVLQVRDKYGNKVLDSTSATNGLQIKIGHVLSNGRYSNTTTDASMLSLDSGVGSYQTIRLDFDSNGRATAVLRVNPLATNSTLAALRASIIDSNGLEIGTPGSARDSGIADTAWLRTDRAPIYVQWSDTFGRVFKPISAGWVGQWYPVRLKVVKDLRGSPFTGDIAAASLGPVFFHPAKGDTSRVNLMTFTGDSLSAIVWIRADDSVTGAWIKGGKDSAADSVGNLNFRYPQVVSASFHDHNCDGKIDSLVVRLNGPLAFRALVGVVAGDSLDAKFPHQLLSPSAFGVPSHAYIYSDTVLSYAWTPDSMLAADAQANRITIGNPLTVGRVLHYTLPQLLDKAPPIAISAFDQQTWANGSTDSLVVKFSETIDLSKFATGSSPPFAVVRAGVATSMTAAKLLKPVVAMDSGVYAFVFSGPSGLLQMGDSLVIDGTSVSDLAGNLSGTSCPNLPFWVELHPKYQPTQGYVLDVDGDGNADSVHLGFKDTLGVLPNSILVQWGTPAETLTVTREQLVSLGVKTSDSAFTVPTNGWHGQTILIDGDTIYNAPRTVGPKDTASFDGGLSFEMLVDRVPPVVIRSRLKWKANLSLSVSFDRPPLDTLVVDFSEGVTGCAVGADPSKCLKANGLNQPIFSEGSSIISTTSTQWTILVPRAKNSIWPGNFIRATAVDSGGALADKSRFNFAGNNSPYVKVLGDPVPPSRGLMLDRDGDGRVDAVLLQYYIKPNVDKLPSFEFDWGDSSGVPVVLASDSSFSIDSTHWIAVLKSPGKYPATGYAPAGIKYNNGRQKSQTMTYGFPVRDSAGPVLKPKAILCPSSLLNGSDTVYVWPSEALNPPLGAVLLEFRRNGVLVPPESIKFQSAIALANGSWQVVIGPGSAYRPSPGDQTRLSTSGSVVDTVTSANLPNPNHAWVTLVGSLRVPYASSYLDLTKDGRIDAAVFDFASPVDSGTRIRVFDPAGSDAYREYTVSAADLGKTHIQFSFADNPWGQDVTSLIKPDLGLLLPSLALDTNVFKGGKFNIQDRVEPVVSSCKLRYTSDTSTVDTLVCRVSEPVTFDPTKSVLRYKSSSEPSDTGIAIIADPRYTMVYDPLKGTITLLLKPFPTGYANPASGDSLRLSLNGVTDPFGNAPGPKTKWVQVLANQRVFPPVIQVSNPVITNDHYSGQKIPGNPIILVGRESSPDGSKPWASLTPAGTWIPGSNTYTPGTKGSNPGENLAGTVIFIQTNLPTTIKIYIYDNVGTYVGQAFQYVSQEMLDQLAKQTNAKTGMVDVGILWKGQREDGRLVSSGVYTVRLLAQRDPVDEEKAQGKTTSSIYNRLVNVGVHLRLNKNWF